MEQETGRPVGEVFADFDQDPVAAASIAQAYRAVLPGGEQVIVKVQRPGIEEMIECDLSILARLARRIEAHTRLGGRLRGV